MNIDPEKLVFIFIIAVLVLGPERLPQAARTLGRAYAQFRKYTSTLQAEVKEVLAEPRAIIDAAVHEAEMTAQLERNNGRTTSSPPSPLSDSAAPAVVESDLLGDGDGDALGGSPVDAGSGLGATLAPGPAVAIPARPGLGAPSSSDEAPDDPNFN
ncbi:MAG TPA: twin-arginine translocase TatA/TatE family subunit [Acidimicrobiales bacterium]|nr:twin-arginine translocase TatA/TatE family subunit [Acidimicrobiales bacterium]